MRTLETWTPPRGLSIPCVTILDPDGEPIEEDQRRLTRYLIQSGRGADVIFVMGTTGECNQLDAARRQRVSQVVNVNPKVKAHFARMALTRAKARALRDALNISMCSVEEIAE